MKNSSLKQALLFSAALTVFVGLGACQSGKNSGWGSKCEACSDCEKSDKTGPKRAGSK
jgi:hypothetical protein